MSSPDDSAAERRIPLEPTPPAVSASVATIAPDVGLRRLDASMTGLVLLLAFFLASFAASNADVWMHLATGRLIARGEYQFGADPFAYTTTGIRWINTSWLSDLLGFSLANALGGPETAPGGAVLVVLKALMIVALAGVLLLVRQPGQRLWVGSVCVCLALLAMSPRLLLQPTCISFFFVGVTLYLLYRSLPNESARASLRSLYLLPPLFLLWANLDGWFLLGPLAVALFLAGEVLQRARGPSDPEESRRLRTTAVVLLVGLAACVVNPFHVQVFGLPPELQTAFSDSPLRRDPYFQSFFLSPLQSTFWTDVHWFPYAGGIGVCVLAGLGVVSFLLNSTNWQWWRVLLWMPFLMLALSHARAIPFFVVVAAPITALNLHDFAEGRFGPGTASRGIRRAWMVGGRVATVLALLALVVLDWPGWLHARADLGVNHRVSWRLTVDTSLRQAASDLCELREQSVVRENGFLSVPDLPCYCAWFCPAEKGFLDYRYHLFPPEITQTFVDVRTALLMKAAAASHQAGDTSPSEGLLRDAFLNTHHPIDHVAVYSPDVQTTIRFATQMMLGSTEHWTWLRGDGRAEIFGWSATPASDAARRFAAHRLDADRRAFGVIAANAANERDRAPRPPRPLNLWEQFVRGPAPHAPGYGAARRYLNYFEIDQEQQARRQARRRDFIQLAALVGGGAVANSNAAGPVGTSLLAYAGDLPARLIGISDGGSVAPLLLAVRAARSAVAENPNDADAWFTLGLSYVALWNYEKTRFSTTPVLNQLREVQTLAALQNAVALRPNYAEAHEILSGIYLNMTHSGDPRIRTHLDLAFEHRKEALQLARAMGPSAGASGEAFDKRFAGAEEFLKKLEQAVQRQRDDFEQRARDPRLASPIAKAQLALELGLAKTAVDVLDKADRAQFSGGEAGFLLQLLISSGRLDPVRELDSQLADPGLKFLFAAAEGDYRRADETLQELIANIERSRTDNLFALFRFQPTPPYPVPGQFYLNSFGSLSQITGLTLDWAEWLAVRGALALEAGANDKAAREFGKVLALGFSVRQPSGIVGLLSASGSLAATSGPLAVAALLEPRIYALVDSKLRVPSERMAATYLALLRKHAQPEAAQAP